MVLIAFRFCSHWKIVSHLFFSMVRDIDVLPCWLASSSMAIYGIFWWFFVVVHISFAPYKFSEFFHFSRAILHGFPTYYADKIVLPMHIVHIIRPLPHYKSFCKCIITIFCFIFSLSFEFAFLPYFFCVSFSLPLLNAACFRFLPPLSLSCRFGFF